MTARRYAPPPRPVATSVTTDRMPMVDRGAPPEVQSAQIAALKAWHEAKGIPYFGPQENPQAESEPGWQIQCSVCGHSGPWRRPIEDLRRAVCGSCGRRGVGHLWKRA